jgi:hypothetical protein
MRAWRTHARFGVLPVSHERRALTPPQTTPHTRPPSGQCGGLWWRKCGCFDMGCFFWGGGGCVSSQATHTHTPPSLPPSLVTSNDHHILFEDEFFLVRGEESERRGGCGIVTSDRLYFGWVVIIKNLNKGKRNASDISVGVLFIPYALFYFFYLLFVP